MQASGTVAGSDLVVVSGSNTVARAATLASGAYVGVAGHDATAGSKLTVIVGHVIHESIADGAITAGDQLTTTNTANRQVKTLAPVASALNPTFSDTEAEGVINTAVNQARAVIGVALSSAADNALVRWMQR